MKNATTTTAPAEEDLSDQILAALAKHHPARPTRSDLIKQLEAGVEPNKRKAVASSGKKRLGRLVTSKVIEERLTLNTGSPRVGLSGRALIAVSLNIETLRLAEKNHNDVVDQIIEETSKWGKIHRFNGSPVPSIAIQDVLMIYGSDHFDLLVFVLHSKEIVAVDGHDHREEVIYQYVREVLHNSVIGVNNTRTMGIASSKSYPML